MIIKGEFVKAYNALPIGDFYLRYEEKRYIATRTESEDGKRGWLYAHEMGGNDHISFNFYRLSRSNRLKPCEMPAQKVIDFILGLEVNGNVEASVKEEKTEIKQSKSFNERFPPEPIHKKLIYWIMDRISAVF